MKTEIKSKVQKILEAHTTATKGFMAEIDQWNKNDMYSDSFKQEKINEIKQKMAQNDVTYNEQLKAVIAEEKAAVIGTPKTKPADYQMQIANALEFIKLAGNKLTDEQAYGILKPFQGDVETMNLFQAVVSNSVQTDLNNNFEKTFGKTNAITVLSNNFEAAESLSASLFNSSEDSLSAGVKTGMFIGNIDAIDKLAETVEG